MSRTPLVPSDLYRLALPSDPQFAPDGRVFFVRATPDRESNRNRSAIWSARSGSAAQPFSAGHRDAQPRVAPDGRHVAFVRDGEGGKRICVAPLDGGEALPVTPAYDELGGLAWSPDSSTLAFVAVAPLDPATARIALDTQSGARHIRALPFKSDDEGLLDGRRKHLFLCRPGSGETEPERLTFGDFNALHPAWSPDGAWLAYDAQVGAAETSFVNDIFVIARSGGEPRRVTHSNGPMSNPAFSHDGHEIAFLGHSHGDDVGGRFNHELFVVGVDGGEPRSLSAGTDRPVIDYVICDIRGVGGQQAPIWAAGDRELYVPFSDRGTCGIAAFARDGSAHRIVAGGERDIYTFTRAEDGSLAFVFSSPLVPSDIVLIDPYGSEEPLTDCNPWLAERNLRAPERVRAEGSDGQELDVFVMRPEGTEPAPYVLQVHGGPHTAYGFAFYFEFQILASHGIGVAFGNPRGSQTYGHAFADAIVGDWGGLDAADVLALLDAAQGAAAIDPARIGVAGGSYGGFMTTWLLGHSKRFAAGVSMRAVNDFVSEVGAADLGWFLERELEAPYSDDAGRKLFEMSPMRAAPAIAAPLLVEHSERDYRCPIDQGEQLFTLLRRLERGPVEFVRFRDDGHNLSRTGNPRNRVLRLRAIAHWLIRHLRPAGVVAPPDTAGVLFSPLPGEPDDTASGAG